MKRPFSQPEKPPEKSLTRRPFFLLAKAPAEKNFARPFANRKALGEFSLISKCPDRITRTGERNMKPDEARALLRKYKVPSNVIAHCEKVAQVSLEFGKRIKARGHRVDLEFLECSALLHDIGRSKRHDILHGVEGASILKDYPKLARVCEVHIFAGVAKEEAKGLGLPEKDYLPKTLEEKIVAHADNLVEGDRVTSGEGKFTRIAKWLGENHPVVRRMYKLKDEIEKLTGNPPGRGRTQGMKGPK
jgi:uncharacterized protein